MTEIPLPLLKRALNFYENAPDGQYDYSVVVPLLEAEIERRTAPEVCPLCLKPASK